MTINQENALYEFLENVAEPFTLEDIVTYIRMVEPKRTGRLSLEIESFINSRNIAFRLGNKRWVSKRGCFEAAPFVISPTRLELLNGILIPGHRCVPFANPVLMPQELRFFWKGKEIPVTTTEGSPEEFYPYYNIFGEEFAAQYIARDNPDNEAAFNDDPYDDPAEVSVHTLDMRNIYRECGFVPGDRFVARTLDWKEGTFNLERVGKDEWSATDLYSWFEAAEGGFEDSFSLLGPGSSTEEQIAYAYWYGGKRIREVPAWSLEDFLYEKTDQIETTAYGIESRFWYAGKEIPDAVGLEESLIRPDKTVVEEILCRAHIPVSEYVVQSYIRDALFRNDSDIIHLIERIVPPLLELKERDGEILANHLAGEIEELQRTYSPFADKTVGPVRQRVGELHTAVIELADRLSKEDIDPAWLPRHTFIVLSQIQNHAAGLLEDLDIEEIPEEELEVIDNSLDSMIETYEDIKELIDDALDSFRRSKLSVVRGSTPEAMGRMVQVGIGGTNIWRRIVIPEALVLEDLHLAIQAVFGWKNVQPHQFNVGGAGARASAKTDGRSSPLAAELKIGELGNLGVVEMLYEYGAKWTVRIILLSRYEGETAAQLRCVAGAGSAPPESVEGPLRFKKCLAALERGGKAEQWGARRELGQNFDPESFDLDACNRNIRDCVRIKKPDQVR